MKNIVYPNYQNSLLNVSNSLFKYYKLKTHYPTHPLVDQALKKDYQHIVVILVDGMGSALLREHLKENSFLLQNKVSEITSVAPSTTSAATTAFLSGKSPLQTGWFAWQQYFKTYDQNIILFLNKDYYTNELVNINIKKNELPYEDLLSQIKKKNPDICVVNSIREDKKKKFLSLRKLLRLIKKQTRQKQATFTYAYYPELDTLMHQEGTKTKKVYKLVNKINLKLERLSKTKKDNTLFIILSDHGQIDTYRINLFLHDDFMKTINGKPAFEGRFASFYVKDETNFIKYYEKHFAKHFLLKTKEELLKENFFGVEQKTKHNHFLGNYYLIATSNYLLDYSETDLNENKISGHHAGLTSEEMMIPLIIV